MQNKLTARTIVVLLATSAGSAFAYRPVERHFPTTPERFVPVLRTPHGNKPLAPLGLETSTLRLDRTPALFHGTASAKPVRGSIDTHARQLAATLAPLFGLTSEDLRFAQTIDVAGLTTVTFAQTHRGIRVDGGFLILTYKDGRIAKVANELVGALPRSTTPKLTRKQAETIASAGAAQISSDFWIDGESTLEIWSDGTIARLAWRTPTKSTSPRSALVFHVDAENGAILAADDRLRYADGEGRVRFLVDEVHTDSPEVPMTVPGLELANNDYTDGDGESLQSTRRTVTYRARTLAVNDESGAQLENLEINFSGPYQIYDVAPQNLAQADPFVHGLAVQAWARLLTPEMSWLGSELAVNVNINDNCNAFWDGYSMNFFRAGSGCTNTGRVSAVVYHEFGHGYHQHLTNNVVGSIGEGTGDYIAATILDTPLMGVGFFDSGAPMRRLDQVNAYPEDYVGEVHEDGLIWAGAMWDLRAAMIAKHGRAEGVRVADRLFVGAVAQGPRLGTSYPSVLAADDDDNDPTNGTPNSCEINAAFDAHGLIAGGQIQNELAATRSFIVIRHDAPGRFPLAAANGMIRIEAEPVNVSSCGTFSADDLVIYFAPGSEGGAYSALPLLSAGSKRYAELNHAVQGNIFRYYFELRADGVTYRNGSPESPHVGLAGDYLELSTEGFETGFGAWTHGTLGQVQELHDDWETGAPHAYASDPELARFGSAVAGTDLGAGIRAGGSNGAAKYSRGSYLMSAPISTTGMEDIRVELWQSVSIKGRLTIKANDRVLWSWTGSEDQQPEAWRYATFALGPELADSASGVVLRFEVEADADNRLGGWTLDQVAVIGTELPKPPPVKDPPGGKDPSGGFGDHELRPGPPDRPQLEPPSAPDISWNGSGAPGGRDERANGVIVTSCVCSGEERTQAPSFVYLGALVALLALRLRITRRGPR